MTYEGKPVKASRLFAGYEHELQVKRIAEHYNQNVNYYKNIRYDAEIIARLQTSSTVPDQRINLKESAFTKRDISQFETDTEAYHQLIVTFVETLSE